MPYPLLILKGEHGSAKSTTARLLLNFVDPGYGAIRAMPGNERDLAVAARNSFMLVFDNLSGISKNMSDALCRLATGGSFAVRKMYSDEDETIFNLRCPVILTGISNTGEREDLQDRSLGVTMQAIPDSARKTEAELDVAFNAVKPRIFGALLDIVAAGLARLPEVELERAPRMADFARFAIACEPALGWEEGSALELLLRSREEMMADALSEDPFGMAVYRTAFQGSATRTANDWQDHFGVFYAEQVRSAGWPKGPRSLSEHLGRITPILRHFGVEVARSRVSGQKMITIHAREDARRDGLI
jgi:hypothetical protein